jgi:hypothetical protein
MDDADILHSIMSVKEMISIGYTLNANHNCDISNNCGLLSGNQPFIK